MVKTIIEPFKIKTVEAVQTVTREEREQIIKDAFYNPFLIPADKVLIDLLTDSGTSAMSAKQWAGILDGDEAYAGSKSWFRFKKVTDKIFGFKHLFPVHQGRAAERILFTNMLSKVAEDGRFINNSEGKVIPSNNHFDTTRANIEFNGGEALDLVIEEGKHPDVIHPFKGNMDTNKLKDVIKERGAENIPVCMITITNNAGGGQPVSMQNLREVSKICREHKIPFFIDACRFAENAYFIKKREKGYENKSILEICNEMFSYADGCTMSAKKDAFANIGGFLAMNDDNIYMNCKNLLIITEGYETYGGLAGRDMEAIAQGLEEIIEESYLNYRIASMEYLGNKLIENGIPIIRPVGGHAIFVDAKAFLSHIPQQQYPGQALTAALYVEGGIRAVEIGSVMFGRNDENGNMIPADMELVRLAIPRRVYTQSHIDYVAEILIEIKNKKDKIKGIKIVEEPKFLRHFTGKFAPVE
ncbi:MAG TPA: tryptophanase [Ignavibacteria bacterium]|nr:tryptophanase [Ignavibacteria bacterium]